MELIYLDNPGPEQEKSHHLVLHNEDQDVSTLYCTVLYCTVSCISSPLHAVDVEQLLGSSLELKSVVFMSYHTPHHTDISPPGGS